MRRFLELLGLPELQRPARLSPHLDRWLRGGSGLLIVFGNTDSGFYPS